MNANVAVVTDVVSRSFFFPIWYRYYGSLFGQDNLFVITYRGLAHLFRDLKLGGLIELPLGFDEATKRSVISQLVSTLLPCFDAIIRVDADEFLVVDPRCAPSLSVYMESFRRPYITARGFDVIQLSGELPLLPDQTTQILQERSFAYPNTALNKTCIVTVPMNWSSGFHWASVYPQFGPVFMLHMKRLDIDWQLRLLQQMSDNIKDNPKVNQDVRNYYSSDEFKVRDYHKGVENRRRYSGIDAWYRDDLIREYLNKINLLPALGFYCGEYGHEHVLCEILSEWKSLF